jgi:thiamine-monophosphate kinase
MWDTGAMPLSETGILARIRARLPGGAELTDDCGEIPSIPSGERLLVTTDVMEEGRHFRREWHPPRLLGRKLLTVNLSDLDASGGRPLGFTLALALPPDLEESWLWELLEGVAEAARESGIPVLGGDTVGRPQGIGLGLTAFGAARRWLRRDGAQAGDRIFVDQPLGASLRGLRALESGQRWDESCPDPDLAAHLDPSPRLGLGIRLAALPEVHACIDLSDGLSKDLAALAEASSCSIRLHPGLHPDEIRGGEDYARCFATSMSQEDIEKILAFPLREVGRAEAWSDAPLLGHMNGLSLPQPDLSFDHFRR